MRIWSIQDRSKHQIAKRPWLVRWKVDGKVCSRSFLFREEADRFRSHMLIAQHNGERFSVHTGEPVSWLPNGGDLPVYGWARHWVAGEWSTWAPRTRDSTTESLARFVPLAVHPKAPPPPLGLRRYLIATFEPGVNIDDEGDAERWLVRWSIPLGGLDRELLADIERCLSVGDAGQTLAASTAGRHRRNARACIQRAVDLGHLDRNPWPPTPKGRSSRKANRTRRAIDPRRLPCPDGMAEILQAIPSHQSGSHTYQIMTAIVYYAGLRPSEVVMLRPRALSLPDVGWGAIEVSEADDGFDEPAEPKTGPRVVDIPIELVALLRSWIAGHGIEPDQLLFRTRTGTRPLPSNWGRALKRACHDVGRPPMRVYDARHACATAWLGSGVPLGEAARWLGHSVETLVSVYIGALEGDDTQAKQRIDESIGPARAWLVQV